MSDDECLARIVVAKATLGERLLILGHHYQREEVFRHADALGDSLKLSRIAAASKAEYIIFCGVHFMTEVADILTPTRLLTWLRVAPWPTSPKLNALCELSEVIVPDGCVTPVTYINSAADLKSFRVDPQHLLWTLESLVAGQVVNQIRVPETVAV